MVANIQSVKDLEFDSNLNRALSSQGNAKFALLLSMLEQDYLQRLSLVEEKAQEPVDSRQLLLDSLDPRPTPPLKTESVHWQREHRAAEYIAQGDLANSKLWLCAFPSPLSLHNDNMRLSDEVVTNCSITTQKRLMADNPSETEKQLKVDETGLYDVLQQLNPIQDPPVLEQAV